MPRRAPQAAAQRDATPLGLRAGDAAWLAADDTEDWVIARVLDATAGALTVRLAHVSAVAESARRGRVVRVWVRRGAFSLEVACSATADGQRPLCRLTLTPLGPLRESVLHPALTPVT